MAMLNTQSVALQLEKVRDRLPLLYERDDMLLTMIQQRGDVQKVSSRNMRLPLQLKPGGKGGYFSPDGGDMGRGGGTTYDVAQVTPVHSRFAVEVTKLVEYATNAPEKAIENAAKREVKNGMAQFRSYLDKQLNAASNGVLATVASINGTTIRCNKPPGAQLVYPFQTVQFFDSTFTTLRGSANVQEVDPFGGQIDSTSSLPQFSVDVVPAGTIATDIVVADGATSGFTPIYGPKYLLSNAITGTWLNLNRATYPVELATPTVNGNNSALVPGQVRLAINKIRKSLGVQQAPKLIAYTNLEQEHQWEQLGVTISQIVKEGAGGRANDLDLLFNGQKTMAGVPIKCSINADPTIIFFLDMSHWGRAVMYDIDYHEVGGNTVFPLYGTSGGLASSYIFYFVTGFQVWVDSPRSAAIINNLSVPSGY